jgi:hypothetical protein
MVRSVIAAILTLLLVAPVAAAQTTEPVGTVAEDETSVSRAYESDAVDPDAIFGIFALGNIADTESQAIGMMTTLPAVLASGLSGTIEDSGATVGAPEEVPVTPIGDQAIATRLTFTMFGTADGELVVLAVRQQTWVQLLVGMGVGSVDVQPQLEALARQALPRWPSTDPVSVRPDGLRVGGIWNMMPLPEDVPAGYTIDPEIEEGPGAGTTAQAPPAVPGTTPETPARDLPLLPTPTPAAGAMPSLPVETPGAGPAVPPVAATEPPAGVATPAPNPRLALPFDVTVEVFLPLDLATMNEDGSCSGAGLLDGLGGDGQITLRDAKDGDASASAPLAAPGQVALDRETGQEICYFRATLTDVPPRAKYTLLAGDTVLGHYSYDDLTETGSILVIVGES